MSSDQAAPDVLVIGSINLDLSLEVERFVEPGQTIIGRDVLRGGGGKGANQAVAAARLGRTVAMMGRVGDDDAGALLVRLLEDEGLQLDHVQTTDDCPTGLAVIEVEDSGENRIVVVSGANARITVADLEPVAELISMTPVVLVQLEIPVEVVQAVAAMSRSGTLVLNPAPSRQSIDLAGVDIVVPNRGELADIVGASAATTNDEIVDQVRLLKDGPEAAVVTLGGDGALVVSGLRTSSIEVEHVAPIPVEPVDTTAAGDSFCGGLADALCLGADVAEAARWAARVAAVTVTRRGAQSSLPRRSDVLT